MGEIADDIIEGRCCGICGQYFSEDGDTIYAHGYPVACLECYEEGCGYEKAEVDTL
jgi:hypothetical protein